MTGLTPVGLTVVTIAGIGEGVGFALSGLGHPRAVKTQMLFENFAMMKFFSAAVGGSLITQAFYSMYDPETFDKSRMDPKISVKKTALYSALMGVGMGISSCGPSLVPTQTVLIRNGYVLLAGSLFGCLCHAILEKMNTVTVCPAIKPEEQNQVHLDKKFGIKYSTLALGMGGAILAGSFGLEAAFPHRRDLESIYGINGPSLFKYALLPTVAGLFPAIAQIPLRVVGLDGNGASGSMMSIVNVLTGGKLAERFKFGKNIATTSQFFYIFIGSMTGALLIKNWNPEPFENKELPSVAKAFIGAAICTFASRMNQACVCGSAITEASGLNIRGFASAAALFAGAIASAVVMEKF